VLPVTCDDAVVSLRLLQSARRSRSPAQAGGNVCTAADGCPARSPAAGFRTNRPSCPRRPASHGGHGARRAGPRRSAALRPQTRHQALADADYLATSRPNITVQILPFSAGAYPATSEAFLHLAFPGGERDIVYIETTIDNRMLEEYDEIERCTMNRTAPADLSAATWRKSARSSGGGSNCVEVAHIPIRDSKNPAGPALIITPAAFRELADGIRRGTLNA
jgi:Domain of unknown function (DUF397)/Domain of unknown function (DUF5753)